MRILWTLLLAFVSIDLARGQNGLSPSSSFDEIFTEYRRGNADAAVAAFTAWQPERVAAEARVGDPQDAKTLAALALLHTEVAMRSGRFGRLAPNAPKRILLTGWGFGDYFEVHSYSAYAIVDRLLKRSRAEDDRGLFSFGKNWYILALSYCVRQNNRLCVRELMDKGEHDLDGAEDPEFLLLIGSLEEPVRVARPGDRRRMPIPFYPQGPGWMVFQSKRAQQARWAFGRALERDPNLLEARMRLGRVYWVTNERQRSERELTVALQQAQASGNEFVTHLSALFLGELYEEMERMDAAVANFRIAVSVFPHAHTASLALGQALVRTGKGDEGWAIGRQMFGNEGPGVAPAVDPYAIYFAAQSWNGASRLRAMRAALRQ
jgi:tetratricopeptide (TPR) repeat protein